MIRITELKLTPDQALNHDLEMANLRRLLISDYIIKEADMLSFSLYRKAIDARKKANVVFVYSIDLELKNENTLLQRGYANVSLFPTNIYNEVPEGMESMKHRPLVVGFGPSGIFSALWLARRGYRPVVLERGPDEDSRSIHIANFLKTGKFSVDASILFGEGGAGTYSDGKLTSMINDVRCKKVLETLVEGGANPEILFVNKPHIGTDKLKQIVKNIRNFIIELGGEVRFNAKVTDFLIEKGTLKGVVINENERLDADVLLLGIGHSARDTFSRLLEYKVILAQKPFSIGLRIEHPQHLVNEAQYGRFATHPALGAADYKLSYHDQNGRSAYTFCMCPGGYVVCSSSEENTVLTNGMSKSQRDAENANSALLVNVVPGDFGSTHPLAGVEFQRRLEKKAFELGGMNYHAPIQLLGDFLNDSLSDQIGSVKPSYLPGVKFVKMTDLLPIFVTDTMKNAIIDFDHKLKGFRFHDAILTGVESRSSSPVRIIRSEDHQANIQGLYPMGEGAGYSGGIMSSAVDGIKTAEKIISRYRLVNLVHEK